MSFARDHSTASRSLASRVASGPVSFNGPFTPSSDPGFGRERRASARAGVQNRRADRIGAINSARSRCPQAAVIPKSP